jgi:hypothetical protein
MRISIIVPALNEEECISQTVRALQQLRGDKEIIVVDGGSSDRTCSLAKAEGARVLSSPAGRGTQMHAGALAATGAVLWFVHADTVPPEHSLNEIHRRLEDPAVAGGNFGLDFDGHSRAARQLTAIYPALASAMEIPGYSSGGMSTIGSAGFDRSPCLKISTFCAGCAELAGSLTCRAGSAHPHGVLSTGTSLGSGYIGPLCRCFIGAAFHRTG